MKEWIGNPSLIKKDETFKYKGCIKYAVNYSTFCSEIDAQDGNDCVYCIQDLCNWKPNGNVRNYFSPLFYVLPNVILFFNLF